LPAVAAAQMTPHRHQALKVLKETLDRMQLSSLAPQRITVEVAVEVAAMQPQAAL
jgi:hypothetical protein